MDQQISLRLPEDLLERLDRRARAARKSRSETIREILAQDLGGRSRSLPPDHPYARVRDLLGSLAGGPPDLAARHREYLVESIRDRRP